MTIRGTRATRFCREAALYIDDEFERQSCAKPFADGSYQGEIVFHGLDKNGCARFSRPMFADQSRTRKLKPVKWTETPTSMFRTLRGEMKWGRTGLKKFLDSPLARAVPQELKENLVGTKFPSAWVKAAFAMAQAPRRRAARNAAKPEGGPTAPD